MTIKLVMQVITTVLLVIVAVFILCHSLKCFINLIELIAVLQSDYFSFLTDLFFISVKTSKKSVSACFVSD